MARRPSKPSATQRSNVAGLAALREKYSVSNQDKISTGIINFDVILGGGLPRGSFVEFASQTGIGKSTVMAHVARNFCAQGKKVFWMDFEHGLTQGLIDGIGLTSYVDNVFTVFDPATYGDAEEILEGITDEEVPDLIIIDSETSMLPDRLSDMTILNMEPGVKARMSSNFMIKYKGWARKRGVTVVFINQMRTKISFLGPSVEDSAGGNALKFYCDIRLRMRRIRDMQKKEITAEGEKITTYGVEACLWAVKNREVRSHIELTLPIVFGRGVSNIQTLKNVLIGSGYVSSSGSYFKINLPGIHEGNVQGNKGLSKFIRERREDIDKFIVENNLLFLVKEAEETEES